MNIYLCDCFFSPFQLRRLYLSRIDCKKAPATQKFKMLILCTKKHVVEQVRYIFFCMFFCRFGVCFYKCLFHAFNKQLETEYLQITLLLSYKVTSHRVYDIPILQLISGKKCMLSRKFVTIKCRRENSRGKEQEKTQKMEMTITMRLMQNKSVYVCLYVCLCLRILNAR